MSAGFLLPWIILQQNGEILVVGKWYTRAPVAQSDGVVPVPTATTSTVEEGNHDDSEDESRLWCYCEQPSFGQMVMYDNKKCPISWFHFECLRIRTPPKGKWYQMVEN